MIIDLQHTENMLSEFDFQCHEVVNWVQSHKIAVRAAHKNVTIRIIVRSLAHRDGAPDRLISHRSDRILLLKRVHIHHVDLLVRSIHEKQLISAVFNIDFVNCETRVTLHDVHKLHLNLSSDFVALVSQDHLSKLLVTHICRPVNLRANVFNFTRTHGVNALT
jgi:hypothetical protein